MGVFEMIDGLKTYKNGGRLDSVDFGLSLLELLWFFVSVGFVIYLPKEPIFLFLPILFIVYTVLGFAYAYFWGPQDKELSVLQNHSIPLWICLTGIFFGAFYAGVSAFIYFEVMVEFVI